jgi:hypothetical protein
VRLYAIEVSALTGAIMKIRNLAPCLLLFVGCGTSQPSGPETLPDLTVPPKPKAGEGLQIITPIVEDIAPGKDYEICTWTDAIVTEQTDVRSTLAYQVEPPGHHLVVFYTTQKQPPGTQRLCTDQDMASFRFLSGNGGNGMPNEAPADLVYRIPAGAQIVLNHHYLNATDQMLRGQAAVNINFAGAGTFTPSGNTAIIDTSIQVPPGKSSHDFSCNFDRTLKYWYIIPHMHKWGTNIKIDLTRSGNVQRLFDTQWDPSYTFHAPELRMNPTTPLIVNKGDKLAIHCEWNNDTPNTLSFGFEMCLSFGQFVDDTGVGSIECNQGSWEPF